ncbi:SHOCT domain-containing protein [Glutamicibacter protophormiae]|uniref:SHOCT domain-containing protein n=1 Tax=Glutamicibacter protophormiae TaxID=37930 RepID=UPI00195B81DD|nr:SHOCT domain-containing protein [Glutamicibacter protophormiae]QRQ79537.1 SHOCT domain-containing protein [Glutamicibacter protophormiae]
MNFDDAPVEFIEEVDTPSSLLDSDPMDTMETVFTGVSILSILFIVVFTLVVVFIIVVWVRNYRAAKNAGVDIFTVQTDIAAKASKSALLAPAQSKEDRLRELDDLRSKQLISAEEYAEARSKVLLG